MNKLVRAFTIGGAAMMAVGAVAADIIYVPTRSLSDQGISLVRWGSGTISETDEAAYEGTTSLRVSSRNFFQGGIMKMAQPVDLSAEAANKDNLLLIALNIPGATASGGGGGAGVSRPGAPGGGGRGGGVTTGQSTGGGGGAGAAEGGAPTGLGGGPQGGGSTGEAQPISKLRLVITTDDGKKSEAYVDVTHASAGERGWMRVGVPLQAINGFGRTSKKITSIAFAPDSVGSFYVGEMRILNDETPVYGEPNIRELNLALGDTFTFSGFGTGGATPLKYTWDFDASNGVTVDAEGQVVTRTFRKPGEYTITMTVQDIYGLKKPHSTTIKVVVNP